MWGDRDSHIHLQSLGEIYGKEGKQDMFTVIKQANNVIIRGQLGRIKVN